MAQSTTFQSGADMVRLSCLILMDEKQQLAEVKSSFFKTWPLVADLGPEDLDAAVANMKLRKFNQDEVIIRQGDKGDTFFIILTGSALVSVRRDDYGDVVLATLRPVTTFGEMSILAGAPRNATVRTLEPSTMIEMDQDSFNQLAQKSALFKDAMDNLYLSRCLSTHLKMTSVFSTLDSQEVEEVVSQAILKNYYPNDMIGKQGEPVYAFLLFKEGVFSIENEQGIQTITVDGSEPRFFGHEEILKSQPWKYSIKALSNVEVVEIHRDEIIRLMDANPEVMVRVATAGQR
jgi:CRP-like cAMP-binding protein